jgi:hypothetical protein
MSRLFHFTLLLGSVLVFCLACLFVWDMYTKAILRPKIHRDLGFELAYVNDPAVPGRRVKRVDYVAPEGIFSRAGFVEGDIIVDDLWLGQLYRVLHRSRGTAMSLHVVQGGDGPPIAEREVRELTFTVPNDAIDARPGEGS